MSESIMWKRQLAKYYQDKKLKNLPALEQGQPVYVQHQSVEKGTTWDPGTVKHVLNDGSYFVSTDVMMHREIILIFENEHVLMGRWWQILSKIHHQLQIL